MSLPTLIASNQRFTDDIYMGLPFIASVPSTRRIDTIFPLTGGGDLSANRSISITMTGGGTLAVSDGRVIAATTPLLVNGGPSATLATDISLSINPFNGLQDGYVVQNPNGIEGKFLKDDGTYGSSTVSGVPSTRTLTMTPPMTIDGLASADLSANRTLDAGVFTAVVKGFVPASGGDPTKALFADGTFKNPIAGAGAVTLQATTPGAADVGNAHISGVMIGDVRLVGGQVAAPAGVASIESYTQSATISGLNRASGASAVPTVSSQRSRGTLAVPTPTQDFDLLGEWSGSGYSGTGGFTSSLAGGILVRADGNAGITQQPCLTDLIGGSVGSFSYNRTTGAGTLFTSGQSSFSTIARPLHTVDINGRLGLRPKVVTASGAGPTYTYTVLASDPTFFLVDATSYEVEFTLPTAVGKTGAVYTIVKVDETLFNRVNVIASGSQSISAATSFSLFAKGESIVVASDGANWWILANNVWSDQSVLAADGAAVASTAAETALPGAYISSWNGAIAPGAVYKTKWAGKLSTTGSPTLRFRIKNSSDGVVADSGAVEMPVSVTNTAWMMSYVGYAQTVGFAQGRVVEATLKIAASDGVLTEFSMFSTFGNPTAGPQPAYVTVQWSASSASNTITCTAMQSELTPRTAVL